MSKPQSRKIKSSSKSKPKPKSSRTVNVGSKTSKSKSNSKSKPKSKKQSQSSQDNPLEIQELLCKILSFFRLKIIVQYGYVNKSWNKASIQPSTAQVLDMNDCYNLTTYSCIKSIDTRFKNIKKFSWSLPKPPNEKTLNNKFARENVLLKQLIQLSKNVKYFNAMESMNIGFYDIDSIILHNVLIAMNKNI